MKYITVKDKIKLCEECLCLELVPKGTDYELDKAPWCGAVPEDGILHAGYNLSRVTFCKKWTGFKAALIQNSKRAVKKND